MTDPQAELKARQGAGARYDAEAAPHAALLQARRGTAFFARKLNEISDAELTQMRRKTIAMVSLEARAMAETLDAMRKGLASLPPRPTATARATSLPARALRGLFEHTAVHLNVVWRDLSGPDWARQIALPDGNLGLAAQTPQLRAQTVWTATLVLDNGAQPRHLPPEFRPG